MLYSKVVEQKADFKIVGSVEQYIDIARQALNVRRIHIGHDRVDLDLGVDASQFAFGRDGFG